MFPKLLLLLPTILFAFSQPSPSNQIILNPNQHHNQNNNQISITPMDQDTFQINWQRKKESKNPFTPMFELQYSGFEIRIEMHQAPYCNAVGCPQPFKFLLLSRDLRLKKYDLKCQGLFGDRQHALKVNGTMVEHQYDIFYLYYFVHDNDFIDLNISCYLNMTLA